MEGIARRRSTGRYAAWFGLWLLYLLNDFLFMRIHSYAAWLAADYAVRLVSIAAFVVLARYSVLPARDTLLAPLPWRSFAGWSAGLSLLGIVIDQAGWRIFARLLPDTAFTAFPSPDNPALEIFDLTLGIALVAVTEEVIFRGYFLALFENTLRGRAALVALSALAFGLIHWSQGLHAVLATALWGIPPILCALRTRSILPAVVAHFATDFVSFSGLVPESWFRWI